MSTFISEPGTRLGGRYRLEDRVSASTGWSAWKAIDETLARAVTVLTFAPGFPQIAEAVTAARAASRLTDARIAQVFDAEDDWDHAYVVMEWVGGDSLDDLLADGPLEPGLGAEIIAQGAEALASAHAVGVSHLCLNPGSLRWTPQGGVKITGLGIAAALAGVTADDPALADTYGLARLLYAALTAHWPGDDWPGLPPAPEVDGHPRSPRQVRAGVPAAIDEITCQALFQRAPAGGQPITTPAMLAAAMARVVLGHPAPPLAVSQPFAPPVLGPMGGAAGGPAHSTGYWDGNGGRGPGAPDALPPAAPRPVPRTMLAAVTLLVLAVAAAGGWVLTHRGGIAPGGPAHASQYPSSTSDLMSVLKPVVASGFDPLSTPVQDPSNENTNEARYAIDSNPGSAWHTQWYATARFGHTKAGTGLMLDMGRAVRLSSVTVTFGAVPGANVRVELGNSVTRSPATLASFKTVATADNAVGRHTFAVSSKAAGRYVLIWFTKLPPNSAGKFEAAVFNVIVRGSR
jgi:hypothetical protein